MGIQNIDYQGDIILGCVVTEREYLVNNEIGYIAYDFANDSFSGYMYINSSFQNAADYYQCLAAELFPNL